MHIQSTVESKGSITHPLPIVERYEKSIGPAGKSHSYSRLPKHKTKWLGKWRSKQRRNISVLSQVPCLPVSAMAQNTNRQEPAGNNPEWYVSLASDL